MNIYIAIILWMIGKKLGMGISYFIVILIGLLCKIVFTNIEE